MLLSMTGFGEARADAPGRSFHAEVRSVNNKFLKVSFRLPERLTPLEADLERIVRSELSRGTVTVSIRQIDGLRSSSSTFHRPTVEAYLKAVDGLGGAVERTGLLGQILLLPGCLEEDFTRDDLSADRPLVEKALREALAGMQRMRRDEGLAMRSVLGEHLAVMERAASTIADLAPLVVEQFRDRLRERVRQALAGHGVELTGADLVREVALFADKADISEELTRLRSHFQQFRELLDSKEAAGRRFDFLLQEIFRESNTIGSKANDARMSPKVVDLKCAVEQARELIQNVE
jgi:uncharacterized protein (TIGR00255 family)